ncbi:MAG: tetratricopeptide repeat protein [Gammaproteobacteria bacterium]|nr:tetratricopeptide repeat protein [Gammaproteobacteria bacterium]
MQDQLNQIQAQMQNQRFADALHALDALRVNGPDKIQAMLMQAVCYRALNQRAEALNVLKQLIDQDPSVVRAYEELGHVHVAGKNADKAILGYREAVQRDPAALNTWKQLAGLYKMTGDQQGMAVAARHIAELSSLPPQLVSAKSHLNQGRIEQADAICREFLQHNKTHVDGMRLLAQIAIQAKIMDDAEFLLESAREFEPDNIAVQLELASVLLKRQKFGAANELAMNLTKLQPDNLEFQSLAAATQQGVGDTNAAIAIYQRLVEVGYQPKSTFLMLGHAHKTAGNLDQSIEAYQRCYAANPEFGDAFWSLANTKTYAFSDAEIAHMTEYEQRDTTSVEDRVHLCFALGKAYEDQQDYYTSFIHYQRGNQLNAELLKDQSPELAPRVQWQKQRCTAELFEQRAGLGHTAPDPIFIVGLPRAGSTLLEQILASHSQVDGTLELPNILSLARRLRGRKPVKVGDEPQYPKILAELEEDYFQRFGQQYIDDTRVFRQDAPLFIDKMPNNFLHIGLIRLILPNAKIIDARRHPMACCFSGFKQLFAEGQEFTYGLAEIGSYYKAYIEMMDHWDEVLPGFVLRVQHEDVVQDLETQVHRMLEFCGLPFEQACLEFHKTKRNVRTPSSEQVRQPIYTTGLEQWRNYEEYLQPLKDALGPDVLQRYPI